MFINPAWSEFRKTWVVFGYCFACAAIGVLLSFLVFGSTLTGVKFWGVCLVITCVMLGVSYGAKYSNPEARVQFTPMDLLQFISQGILWPSTWPTFASRLGIQPIGPPQQASEWLQELQRWV